MGFFKMHKSGSLCDTCLISLCERAVFLMEKKGVFLEGSRTQRGHSPALVSGYHQLCSLQNGDF